MQRHGARKNHKHFQKLGSLGVPMAGKQWDLMIRNSHQARRDMHALQRRSGFILYKIRTPKVF